MAQARTEAALGLVFSLQRPTRVNLGLPMSS